EARLLEPDGWASLVGRHWIEPGSHCVGSSAASSIPLAVGPPELGLLKMVGDRLTPQPAAGADVTVDGAPAEGAVVLRDDGARGGPSLIGFDGGDGQAMVIARRGQLALRVKHAQAPSRLEFAGLDYWPADPSWVVEASFVPN